ncbi:MAG: hypothetical protein MJZ29_08000 [Bacteroidaceae bacterium]|nr:hypothetical protein [Bacteroidaceae bacterium]
MKKQILLALAILFCAQIVSASNILENSGNSITESELSNVSLDQVQKVPLVGTWKDNGDLTSMFMSADDGEDNVDMKDAKIYLTFTANKMTMKIDTSMDADGIAMSMKMTADFSYTRSGKVLNVKFISAKLTSIDINLNPEMKSAFAAQGINKSQLNEMFMQQLGPEFEKEMADSGLKQWDKLTITKLTNKQLVLNDDTTSITLTRVK